MWVVYLEESGEEKEFSTREEAMKWIKQVMDFDRRHNLVGEVYTLRYESE